MLRNSIDVNLGSYWHGTVCPRSMSPYVVTMPQRYKIYMFVVMKIHLNLFIRLTRYTYSIIDRQVNK